MTKPGAVWSDPSPHTTHFLTVNGVRLHYLDWGGAGEPLVLIPGLGDSPHCYDDLAPALRDRCRVLAYARRGHGRSGAKPPYDADTLTEDLRQLVDSLGLDIVNLAGWSLGGREITRFAELYPARVHKLVYLDAAYDREDPAWRQAAENPALSLFPAPEALGSLDTYRRWWQTTWFTDAPWSDAAEAYMRDLVVEEPDSRLRAATSDTVLAAILAAIVNPGGYRRDYRKVRAATLFIVPASYVPMTLRDPALRRKAAEWHERHYRPFRLATIARLRRELPGAEIVELPGGNHNDFLFSQRAEVIAAVRDFLAR